MAFQLLYCFINKILHGSKTISLIALFYYTMFNIFHYGHSILNLNSSDPLPKLFFFVKALFILLFLFLRYFSVLIIFLWKYLCQSLFMIFRFYHGLFMFRACILCFQIFTLYPLFFSACLLTTALHSSQVRALYFILQGTSR